MRRHRDRLQRRGDRRGRFPSRAAGGRMVPCRGRGRHGLCGGCRCGQGRLTPSTVLTDQGSRAFHVLQPDRLRRPIGQGRRRGGGIATGMLGKRGRADHEQIGDVPALQVAVDGAGAGIVAHDRAAGGIAEMAGRRRFRRSRGIGRRFVPDRRVVRPQGGPELPGDGGKVPGDAQVVGAVIEGQPQQRPSPGVLVDGVEVEAVAAIGHGRPIGLDAHGTVVPMLHRALPGAAPAGRAGRHRVVADRMGAAAGGDDRTTADEIEAGMVEIVAVEIVDGHAERTRAHEIVEYPVAEEQRRRRLRLVGVVGADHPPPRRRVVRLADTRHQHQVDVAEYPGGQHDHIGGLLERVPGGVEIGHPGGPRAIPTAIDPQHLRPRAEPETGRAPRGRKHRGLRAGLGRHGAAEPLAETAIAACRHRHAVGVGVGPGRIGRGQWERVQAETAGGGLEQDHGQAGVQRRIGVTARARRLERVAALDDAAADVAGLARNAADIFETVVKRFEVLAGKGPVADRHVRADRFFAVPADDPAAQAEIRGEQAQGAPAPGRPAPAHSLARTEIPQPAQGQRRLAGMVAEGDGLARGVLGQLAAHRDAQLVVHVARGEIRMRVPPFPPFQADHRETQIGQFAGKDRAAPSHADDHGIDRFQPRRHRRDAYCRSASVTGSTGNGLSRNARMSRA